MAKISMHYPCTIGPSVPAGLGGLESLTDSACRSRAARGPSRPSIRANPPGKHPCQYWHDDVGGIISGESGLDAERTLFIVASKTFTTLETLQNADAARSWLVERSDNPTAVARHFVAITSNVSGACAFGIDSANVYPMWDWVGGRYSLWSAVGMPIALAAGFGFTTTVVSAESVIPSASVTVSV